MKTNEELNKLPVFKDFRCYLCGISINETVLNLEEYLYRGAQATCVDKAACLCRQRQLDPRQTHTADPRQAKPL